MVRFGPKLERRQAVLFRGVEIGAELFAMTAACVYAHDEAARGTGDARALADVFCREAARRVDERFREFFGPNDGAMYRLSQAVLGGEYAWMEEGVISAWETANG